MKGHIFQLLEQFIEETAGPEAVEAIRGRCEFSGDGVFVRPGNYPDEDMVEYVRRTVDYLGISVADAHRAFGQWIFPHLAGLVPTEVTQRDHPIDFLLDLDRVHEVELKKLWPDARPPRFVAERTGPSTMRLRYDSPRQMFELLDGVLTSLSDYYGVELTFERQLVDGPDGYQLADYDITFTDVTNADGTDSGVAAGIGATPEHA
jgi:hypothetical protein